MLKPIFIVIITCLILPAFGFTQKIDRKALVQRHNPVIIKPGALSSLTVGNGKFAFTVDITGLQTFPLNYQKGVSLGTESEWGWHSFPDTLGYKREEALKSYHLNGRDVTYSVQWNSPDRHKAAANWFRQNPHRLQLGNIGLEILKRNGQEITLADIHNIKQVLDLWTGAIRSSFTIEGVPVHVTTYCHNLQDAIAAKIESPLLKEGRLRCRITLPYPTGEWADEGVNYTNSGKHVSGVTIINKYKAIIEHKLDTTDYFIHLQWSNTATIENTKPHHFLIVPARTNTGPFEFTASFQQKKNLSPIPSFIDTRSSSETGWRKYWTSGGAIDFAGSADPRAFEIERRVILSQYLLRAQEAGSFPPQETGLTYNSWYGKSHLEMMWWHAAHYALWGRAELLERELNWYSTVATNARAIAARQGYQGVRWQKMTDNNGEEAPSSVGAFLIWQQPHYIYFAELCYRNKKDNATLNRYKDLVFATADFMASFAHYDSATKRYILGKGVIPAQERFKPEETYNPAYELVYWNWALSTAQEWRKRLHLPQNRKWNDVIANLSRLAIQDNKYLFTESAKDSYTNPEFRTDHPSVLAAFGVMPATGQVNTSVMRNTFDWIWQNWRWNDTWGWDFPMTAMTATRLGLQERAIQSLLMNIHTNTYLVNGHNYQDERLRIYLPGNGGLLTAIAMMVAGYDGSSTLPGIPHDGKWKVRWEGLKRMP
jgi:protein-glucosylgalactosylhydroxylysine glucosidase